jgi:2-iminobutanoate/2-iminopropanoate deaminase
MNTTITLTSPPDVFPATNYEHVSLAGDFAYVAGQVARDEAGNWVGIGDAGAQAAQVYRNIGRILAHIGATPEDVVKIMVFLTDRADAPAIHAERRKFFGDHRPPHSGIIIGGLGSPEVKVEVEVIVYLPKDRQRLPGAVEPGLAP